MRFLLYLSAFVLLDALVPAGCRSERPTPHMIPYEYQEDDSIDENLTDSIEAADSITIKGDEA